MSPPGQRATPGTTPGASSNIKVTTTESKCNPLVKVEVAGRIEAAASLASYCILAEIEQDVALVGIVRLLETASQFLEVAAAERLLAGVA